MAGLNNPKNLVGTCFIQSSRNFVIMLILVISRLNYKLGHVASKSRSQGQMTEKLCVHSRGHSFEPKFMKLCQNVNSYKNLGHI